MKNMVGIIFLLNHLTSVVLCGPVVSAVICLGPVAAGGLTACLWGIALFCSPRIPLTWLTSASAGCVLLEISVWDCLVAPSGTAQESSFCCDPILIEFPKSLHPLWLLETNSYTDNTPHPNNIKSDYDTKS